MKNKDTKLLLVLAAVGLVVAGIILYMNNFFKGTNLIFEKLSQGEVLAGIVIAFPTLVTWKQAIEQSKENKKNVVSDNVRDTVKYYDKQLTDLVADISKTKELPFYKAGKIEYIIDTYNKLLKEWNGVLKLDISLDFVQVLSTICSIKYPEGIDSPVEFSCAIGDENIGDMPYEEIVRIAKEYIDSVGGFEKFAEWGLF